MAELEVDADNFVNPLGTAKVSLEGSGSSASTAFENEAVNEPEKTFEQDGVDETNADSWGTLAAGNAFIKGDIDAAILVSLRRSLPAQHPAQAYRSPAIFLRRRFSLTNMRRLAALVPKRMCVELVGHLGAHRHHV